jgi:hypothetical protein
MTDKGLGFIHNVNLAWLDAAAESRLRSSDLLSMREELDQLLKDEVRGVGSRRKTIDVLVSIWQKSEAVDAELFNQALNFLPRILFTEHIWLHYGLTLLYYPFFRQTAAIVGQFARTGEPITRQAVKGRLASELGHLGSLNRASERIVASLVNWGALVYQKKGSTYLPQMQTFKTDSPELQCWLLACALSGHPADQLPFLDLIRLPELFPFFLSVSTDVLRKNSRINIQKQGMWDMVQLSEYGGVQ